MRRASLINFVALFINFRALAALAKAAQIRQCLDCQSPNWKGEINGFVAN